MPRLVNPNAFLAYLSPPKHSAVFLRLCFFFFFVLRCFLCVVRRLAASSPKLLAETPPRGWNSYDSYSWIISEEDFLENAEIVSNRLLRYGYEYVVVDYLWYRKFAEGSYTDAYGFDNIDEWGRVVPDPERWPSTNGGKGFTEVARRVHNMGLKFGIHAMRGISAQAVNSSTPILDIQTGRPFAEEGRVWNANDIGMREGACAWMPHGFMSVNTNLAAGKAFLLSLYQQYADWGVDFVKLDCVFGEDLDTAEVITVSEILSRIERPILLSLSPGKFATPAMAERLRSHVNMYRITGDDWDLWNDVQSHFDVSRDFASSRLIGADGLRGKSWPDLDMLPLGWLTDPGANEGPHRRCRLTPDEQKTQITLWSMARSPLMFGGDLKNIDDNTFNLITNTAILEINSFSTDNKEFPFVVGNKDLSRWLPPALARSARNSQDSDGLSNSVLSLTNCENPKAKGWHKKMYDHDRNAICWDDKQRNMRPFCLYKKQPPLTLEQKSIYEGRNEENLYFSFGESTATCLDATSNAKFSSTAVDRFMFPCKWSVNQMWSLNSNGTLVSTYSGLCATIEAVKDNPYAGGIRSWIARGRRGEIYYAVFNLNPTSTVASAKVEDMAKVLGEKSHLTRPCNATEVWSRKSSAPLGDVLSTRVNAHGCALFVILCK